MIPSSTSVLTVVEGTTGTMVESFLDEFEEPLDIANNVAGPIVILYDNKSNVISNNVAVPDSKGNIGDWSVDLTIPDIGLETKVEFLTMWTFKCSDGTIYKSKRVLFAEPKEDTRTSDVVIVVGRDEFIQVSLPVNFKMPTEKQEADIARGIPASKSVDGDRMVVHLFRNNEAMYGDGLDSDVPNSGVKITSYIDKTTVSVPAVVGKAKLEPLLLMIDIHKVGALVPISLTYKLWPVTPQIIVATTQLEDFINKARIQNVIPELDYTQSDLIQYLHRGLMLFNGFAPHTTNFTGTNMQGVLYDAWLQCSSYYALASQLQAEGALAFDFSGQSVNLNIDRTPAIESALGRIESSMDSSIKPMKKLLVRSGLTDGDGSAGGSNIDGSRHIGTLGITNSPTTKLPYAGRRGIWFQSFSH